MIGDWHVVRDEVQHTPINEKERLTFLGASKHAFIYEDSSGIPLFHVDIYRSEE